MQTLRAILGSSGRLRRFRLERDQAGMSVTAGAGEALMRLGSRLGPICSRRVWPCPSLLRRQRDQARLLDPAGSANTEHRADLEHGAYRPAPGGLL